MNEGDSSSSPAPRGAPGERSERFLRAAEEKGRLSAEQARDVRRLLGALAEVGVELTPAEIAVRKGFLTAEAAKALERWLARRHVGKYEILEKLGEGGAGVVWRARDTKLDRVVALKVLARRMEGTDLFRARFLREARVAVTLNHVNIVRGLDYGEADGYRFFAMEFVDGESLAQRLEWEGRLQEKDAFRIARKVVHALDYVQQFGLVHRDIKPENLLLAESGEVKLCDLGLAKPTLEEAQRVHGSAAAGTPLYMAPEQIRDPDAVDWRTDVYGLGATLFHALTGNPPFRTDAAGTVIHKHLAAPAPNPRELVLELSQGAAAVVLKALQKDPLRRYGSLADLAADLEAVGDGRPPIHALEITTRDSGILDAAVRGPAARPPRRLGRVALVAAGWLVAVGALGYGLWTFGDRVVDPLPAQPQQQAPLPAPPTSPDGPSAPERDPGSAPQRPSPQEQERREDARAALEQARQFALDDADDLDRARVQYEFVADRYTDLPQGDEARAALELVNERRDEYARSELAAREGRAAQAERAGRLGAAWAEFDGFPERYLDTAPAAVARKEAARLRKTSALKERESLARIDAFLTNFQFDSARKEHAAAMAAAVPSPSAQLISVADRIAGAAADFDEQRLLQRDAYELLAGRALRTAVGQGVKAARRLLADASLPLFRSELRELDAQLERLARVRERLALMPPARPVAEGPAPYPEALDAGDPDHLEGWGLLGAARGDLESARRAADGLNELGDGAAARRLLDRIAHVRRALVDEVDGLIARAAEETNDGAALRILDGALALLPDDQRTHLARGKRLRNRRDKRSARKAFERARPLPGAHYELARLANERGDLDVAEQELSSGLAGEPGLSLRSDMEDLLVTVRAKRADQRVRRLELQLRSARGEDREGVCRQLLEHKPDHTEALRILGESYAEDHRDDWRRIVDGVLLLERYLATGTARSAKRRDVEDLLEGLAPFRADDASARALVEAGLARARDGATEEAKQLFERALHRMPFHVPAHLGYADALTAPARRLGADRTGLRPAIEAYSRLLRLDPEHVGARTGRAEARLLSGDLEGAILDAEAALANADYTDDRPALIAGRGYLMRGDAETALTRFETAHGRSPSAESLIRQAQAFMALGKYAAAAGALDEIEGKTIPDDLMQLYERLADEAGR